MPTYRQRGTTWRAELYKHGRRESATFSTKRKAVAWATQREAELTGAKLPDRTLADALDRFKAEKCPGRKGGRWEALRLDLYRRDPLARRMLHTLSRTDIADLRDRRLSKVGPASVRRELNLLIAVLEECAGDWGWLRSNPARGVKRPPNSPARRRRIADDEVARATLALGLLEPLEGLTMRQRTALAFLFALETGMRSGEILGLRWEDIAGKVARLPATKNGDVREVPLSARAREILDALPRGDAPCFDVPGPTRDALFRRAVKVAGLVGLRFHDSRAEAVYRLSRKLDVMELADMIGHRDIRSLLHYYRTDKAELADRL